MVRLPSVLLCGLLITGILVGCQTLSVPSYYSLDIDELSERIADKERELEALQNEKDRQIEEKGQVDPSIESRLKELTDEIRGMTRWRRRLVNQKTSGRISGPI